MTGAGGRPVLRMARLARPAAGRLALATLTGVGAALCGIGLMAASAWLISRAAQHPPVLHLSVAIVAVRAFGLGRGGLRYAERLAGHDAGFRVLGAIRERGYAALERLSPVGLAGTRSGDLAARFVSDVDAAVDVITRVLLPYVVALLAGAAAAAFVTSLLPAAGAVLFAGVLLACVAGPAIQSTLARRADRRSVPLRGELAAQVVELIHGAPDVAAYGAGSDRLAAIATTDRHLRRAEGRTSVSLGAGGATAALLGGACVWAALGLGVPAVRAGTLDGVLLAVIVLTPMAVFETVAALPAASAQLATARAALARVFDILDRPAPVMDPATPASLPDPPYEVRVENATARWEAGDPPAITSASLDLAPADRVALVGPNGSGKSTIAALLVRFIDPTAGRVTINGIDARHLAADDVRRVVGLVADDAFVFDTTIRQNLRIGKPDATVHEIRAALAEARLLEWVDGLPDGLDTDVGERGGRLSGGQRRRLVLARALLADFPVLVLDEPTEHLDRDTAARITADVLAATSGRTVLLITHHPYGLDMVDRLVALPPPVARERGPGQGHTGPMGEICAHIDQVRNVTPSSTGCEECLALGRNDWVHLRVCQSCGHVGCCDNSPLRHATAHFRAGAHPIIRSYEPGEDWYWCYVDEVGFELEGAPRAPSHP